MCIFTFYFEKWVINFKTYFNREQKLRILLLFLRRGGGSGDSVNKKSISKYKKKRKKDYKI